MFGPTSKKGGGSGGSSKGSAKQKTQAEIYAQQRMNQGLMRVGIVFALMLFFLIPVLPGTIADVAWKDYVWNETPLGGVLGMEMPPPMDDLELPLGVTIPSFSLLRWIELALIPAGLFLAATLVQHLFTLAVQSIVANKAQRRYLRVRVPASEKGIKASGGIGLLRTLHGQIPPRNPMKGSPAPLILRWTDLPEQAVVQGVSVLDTPDVATPVTKTLQGIAANTDVDVWTKKGQAIDPLRNELQPGRVLCTCDMRLTAPDDLPISLVSGTESPVLDSLLPAMATQTGIYATDVQVILSPVPDMGSWRNRVMARLDGLKVDTQAGERKVMEQKAAGPGFDVTVRLFAVAESAQAGTIMIQTMASALAGTVQIIGNAQQRLRSGPTRTFPAVLPEKRPLPMPSRGLIFTLALLAIIGLGIAHVWLGWDARWHMLTTAGVGVLGLWLATWLRKKTGANVRQEYRYALNGVTAPRNPNCIPLWADWFGRKPTVLSAAEIAALWHPPTDDIGSWVTRTMSRWLPCPGKAFVDPENPRNLLLGTARTSAGSYAPIGFDFAEARFIVHITAPMGRGKSEWLKTYFSGLMRAQAGCMVLDCKGTSLVKDVMLCIPQEREQDVVILELGENRVTGEDMRPTMNLLSPEYGRSMGLDSSLLASTIMGVFGALDPKFKDAVGMQEFARNGLLALLEGEPNASMMHLIRFYGDEDYRAEVVSRLENNPSVRDFWERRFVEMSDGEKSSIGPFQRRLDQLLAFPELQAMLVAPGCSIDIRNMMDNGGILLAGIRATQGPIASIAANLLMTQVSLAALSRDNVPESQRPDWTMILDEAQIIFGANPGMAPVIFSQFRSFRVGSVVVHQNLGQLSNIMDVLGGNAQYRVILGSEMIDAQTYGSQYRALGLTPSDFVSMPKFEMQYMKMMGTNLFSTRMPPLIEPLEEPMPEPVYQNWQTVRAPARNDDERRIDSVIVQFRELARVRPQDAIRRLGVLCRERPEKFAAYCGRTRAHREAQRRFILDNPGCIRVNPDLPPDKAALDQKNRRIRILSALRAGVPRLETQALTWAILMDVKISAEIRAEREAAEQEAKKASRRGKKSTSASPPPPPRAPESSAPTGSTEPLPRPMRQEAPDASGANASVVPVDTNGQPDFQALPTLEELQRQRGSRRASDDRVIGMSGLEGEGSDGAADTVEDPEDTFDILLDDAS